MTWKVMKSQLPAVVTQLVFPFLCFSPGDQQVLMRRRARNALGTATH
jgi:hypothetical protein